MKKITLFALSIAMLAGCAQKENIAPEMSESKPVTLRFEVNYPEAEAGTKVTFGEAVGENKPQLEWTGDETMALVFGKYGAGGADNSVMVTLPSTEKGVFAGTVTPPDGFTISDLQGFVIPAENAPRYDFRDSVNARIIMNVPQQQTQENPGEPNWTYNPFFYDLHGTEWNAEQTEFTFENLTLKSAAEMVRLNIYGKHPEMSDDEVLESVTFVSATNIASGTAEWVLGSTGTTYKNNGSKSPAVVTLTNGVTIADKSKENGVEMWMSIMGGSTKTVTSIKVVTDKAVYVKDIESQTIAGKNVTKFNVYQVGVNLANGYIRYATEPSYSVDGGDTWVSTIPETFTQLAVKNQMTAEQLTEVKTKIDAQETPVELDLSRTLYESTTFPAAFAGTSEAMNTKLKSINFPSNVNTLAKSAFRYCSALESVDLDNIKTLSDYTFANTGLKSISVKEQVSELGKYTFAYCYNLEEIYFNSTDADLANPSSEGPSLYTFVFAEAKVDSHTVDMVCTIGPKARVPKAGFQYNANLTKLTMEATVSTSSASASAGRQGNSSLTNVKYLATVITKGNNWFYDGNYSNVGVSVPEGTTKYCVVPDGKITTYQKLRLWQGNNGDKGLQSFGFTLIEQSEYDKLQNGSTETADE